MNKMKKTLLKKTKYPGNLQRNQFLSTGSTLLNLACSNRYYGGFVRGKFHLIVGDSVSGKTFLAYTSLAEAASDATFNYYRLIVDDIEGGAMFNIETLFGKALARRVEILHSTSLENMYDNMDDCIKDGRPFIYIIDSMDSLDSEEDSEKYQKQKTARRKGKVEAGTYGTSKAKANSAGLRRLMTPLRDSKSIVLMIAQTRDNLGFGFDKKTRSGGRSLRFYATLEIWSSIREKIKKTVKGKPRTIGIKSKLEIKKNRISGRERTVVVPIYYDYGFDDIGSCIDFLVEEKHWRKTTGGINAVEFNFKGSQESLIKQIEEDDSELMLQRLVQKVWSEIDVACGLKRKPKYI